MAVKGAVMVPHPPLIIPDVGRGQEKAIQATIDAYHKAAKKIASWKPDTVVVLSPHSIMYADYFHISPGTGARGDFGQFRAPQVKIQVQYDTELVEALSQEAEARGIPAGTMGERDSRLDHATMIPLWFLNHYYTDYKTVRIGLSGLPLSQHYMLGQCIQKAAELCGRNIVVIGSGDLSHKLKEDGPYGFQKEGPEYDSRIMEVMGAAAFDQLFDFTEEFCDKAAECGHRSFVILAGTLDRLAVKAEKLSHEEPSASGMASVPMRWKAGRRNGTFCVSTRRKSQMKPNAGKNSKTHMFVWPVRPSRLTWAKESKSLSKIPAARNV